MEVLLALAGTVTMLIEVVKKFLEQVTLPEEWRKLLLLVLSLVIGIGLVASSPDTLSDPEVAGLLGILPGWLQILTAGVLVGLGSKVIHELFSIAGRLRDSLEMLGEVRKEEARAMRAGTINFVSGQIEQVSGSNISDR